MVLVILLEFIFSFLFQFRFPLIDKRGCNNLIAFLSCFLVSISVLFNYDILLLLSNKYVFNTYIIAYLQNLAGSEDTVNFIVSLQDRGKICMEMFSSSCDKGCCKLYKMVNNFKELLKNKTFLSPMALPYP